VQHALASRPDDETLRAAEARLLLDRRLSPFAKTNTREIEWRNGFIRSARIHETSGLARLLRHPAAAMLRNLWLVENRDLVPMLVSGPALPHLRQLVLERAHTDETRLDLRRFRRLAHVEIEAYELASVELPPLQRLFMRVQDTVQNLYAVRAAPGERLVEVEIRCDHWEEDGTGMGVFRELFARTDLRALRVLRLYGATEDYFGALANAPFAPQLETLDLTGTFVGANAVAALVAAQPRFHALRVLVAETREARGLREAFGECLRLEPVPRPFARWNGY
jgi:hypothetical protein